MLRVTFFAAIFIFMTNLAHSNGFEVEAFQETLRIFGIIFEVVDENFNGAITDGMSNFVDRAKDTIAGAITEKPEGNTE